MNVSRTIKQLLAERAKHSALFEKARQQLQAPELVEARKVFHEANMAIIRVDLALRSVRSVCTHKFKSTVIDNAGTKEFTCINCGYSYED